jgi:hypothetical protein
MKKVYILSEEQAESLKSIQNKLECDLSLLNDALETIICNDDIHQIFEKLSQLSDDMKDVLTSE